MNGFFREDKVSLKRGFYRIVVHSLAQNEAFKNTTYHDVHITVAVNRTTL